MAVDESAPPVGASYVVVARDYADIAHLENANVIERILSSSRSEKLAYVSALLTSGLSKYTLAGPKVALAAMAVEALTDFGQEVSAWITVGKIPADFSGRPSGYQTWVELLAEIDSNPTDADRVRAMKAMFLASNRVSATDAESILAYHLFQIAKKLNSGELLLLKGIDEARNSGNWPHHSESCHASFWRSAIAKKLGHSLVGLVKQHERALVEYGLITDSYMSGQLELIQEDFARMSDLGIRFCANIDSYRVEGEKLGSGKD